MLASLSNMAAEQAVFLESDYELLSRLDFIFARAALSPTIDAVNPSSTPTDTFRSKTRDIPFCLQRPWCPSP